LPGTIRSDYATSTRNNLVHVSDSVEKANYETNLFFGNDNILNDNILKDIILEAKSESEINLGERITKF